jgi:hypothetical protein
MGQRRVTVDGSGNVYTTGYFIGPTDFDPGPGVFQLTSAGSSETFVVKLDGAGNFIWARQLGGGSGNSLAVDQSGNVFTTGIFFGAADFDPGPGVFNLDAAGGDDIFVSKLDGAGNFVWARQVGSMKYEWAGGVALDASGSVYATGYFSDTVDFDPGPGMFPLSSAGDQDLFLSKLDDDGNFIWARSLGGSGEDRGLAVTVDVGGSVYATGYFSIRSTSTRVRVASI